MAKAIDKVAIQSRYRYSSLSNRIDSNTLTQDDIMPRQPFGDFLNPQSPAGRGNSSSRGRGGGGGRGRGGKAKQDYSDVPPIDYNAINRQTYKQIDGQSGRRM